MKLITNRWIAKREEGVLRPVWWCVLKFNPPFISLLKHILFPKNVTVTPPPHLTSRYEIIKC